MSPAKLDDETRRMILEPLQIGRKGMAACGWQVTGDEASEAFHSFNRGVARLSGTSVGREAMESRGAELPVLDWLSADWPNILKFLVNVHEAKRLSRKQVVSCVEKLRLLSENFAAEEAATAGVPWREAAPKRGDSGEEFKAEPREEPEDPPPPPPPLPPPEEEVKEVKAEEKPGGFLMRLFGGKEDPPAAPPPAPVPSPTVILPKAPPEGPAAGGYPSGGSAPSRAPKDVKPGVVWVDVAPKAWQKSKLDSHAGICFQGFDGNTESRPWVEYVKQRAASHERVAVLIMNRRHKGDAVAIRQHCVSMRLQPPRFVVCGRASPEDVCREWGMQDILVTSNWDEAASIALSEVQTPVPEGRRRSAAGIDM